MKGLIAHTYVRLVLQLLLVSAIDLLVKFFGKSLFDWVHVVWSSLVKYVDLGSSLVWLHIAFTHFSLIISSIIVVNVLQLVHLC